MARGMPSMVALLGMLAVAGYQNRDKLGELLGNATGNRPNDPNQPDRVAQGTQNGQGGLGDLLGGLGGLLGGATAGSVLNGGLGDLVDRFRQTGRGDKAESWINPGSNATCDAADLEAALGEETISELTAKTGLSRSELLDRLCQTLPDAVDKMTPEGRMPSYTEPRTAF
jgi:uncharacterized protein YidB (DUF937 family)